MRRLFLVGVLLLITGVLAAPASARLLPSITLDPTSACPGATVTVVADPEPGAFSSWKVFWDDTTGDPLAEGAWPVTPTFAVPDGAGYGSSHQVIFVRTTTFPPSTAEYVPEPFMVRSLPQCVAIATIPTIPILTVPTLTVPLPDGDGDGVTTLLDNCPDVANPGQQDADSDGLGDVCDPDRDGDGVGDAIDAFPDDPTESADLDGDGVGDTVDLDRDGDGVGNATDAYPNDPAESADLDGDGIGDNADNCPTVANPTQEDLDFDGAGDACAATAPPTTGPGAATTEVAEVTTTLSTPTESGGASSVVWWIGGGVLGLAAIAAAFAVGRRGRR